MNNEYKELKKTYLLNKKLIRSLMLQNQKIKEQFYNNNICINCGGKLGKEISNRVVGIYNRYKVCTQCYQIKTPVIGLHVSEYVNITEVRR